MDIVIDANVFLSALISPGGKTCEMLFNDRLKLFAPEWLLEEFEEHKQEILAIKMYKHEILVIIEA